MKKDYLANELWILAWNASVQHASIYKTGAWKNNSKEISAFRKKIISYISQNLIPKYKTTVPESDHCENIASLIDFANKADTDSILGNAGYKYGVAQKLLNLSLKYYWCLDEITEPPHCPVDRIIIDKTLFRGQINWTEITTEADYLKVIQEIDQLAQQSKQSIAIWELSEYERR